MIKKLWCKWFGHKQRLNVCECPKTEELLKAINSGHHFHEVRCERCGVLFMLGY